MNAAELKAYFQEQATKAGMTAEEMAPFLNTLATDKGAKFVSDAFVPMSQHHKTLDAKRAEWESAKAEYDRTLAAWQDYGNKSQTELQKAQNIQAMLQQYQAAYGPITAEQGQQLVAQAGGGHVSPQEIQKMMGSELSTRAAQFNAVAKTYARASADHLKRFGETLDLDDYEQFAMKRGGAPWDAYQAYIQPKEEAQRAKVEAEREEQRKRDEDRRVQERVQQELSARGVRTSPKEDLSPFKLNMERAAAKAAGQDQSPEAKSKSAFFEAWEKGTPDRAA